MGNGVVGRPYRGFGATLRRKPVVSPQAFYLSFLSGLWDLAQVSIICVESAVLL